MGTITVVGYFGSNNRAHKAMCSLVAASPMQCTVEVNDWGRKRRHELTYDRLTMPDGEPIGYLRAIELLAGTAKDGGSRAYE